MHFIVDESTGTRVVAYLRSLGHDALAVAEIMPQVDDLDILARAVSEGRILITNDKDLRTDKRTVCRIDIHRRE